MRVLAPALSRWPYREKAMAQRNRPSVVMLTADRQIDRRIVQEADSLEADGWEVTIIAMPLDHPASGDDPRIIRLAPSRTAPSRESLLVAGYRMARRFMAMNGPAMRFAKEAVWRFLADPEQVYSNLFEAAAMQYSPTVFLAHDLPMLPVATKAARAKGAKLAYDSHELYAEKEFSARQRARWREIEAKYIGGADLVTTVNPSIARELEQRYGLAKVEVILNADKVRDAPVVARPLRQRLGLPEQARILLFQGGIIANRNLETTVAAMALIADPQIHLVLLGDGQLREGLSRLARRNRVEARVHLVPAVPQKELVEWSAGADIGLVPYQGVSLNSYYCTPNKLFEFIAAGLPMLVSDLPELSRIIGEYDIGMVGDLSTAELAAKAIQRVFVDASRLARWRNNLVRARRELNWEVEGRRFVSLFARLR